jgi:hypothetical protein
MYARPWVPWASARFVVIIVDSVTSTEYGDDELNARQMHLGGGGWCRLNHPG